MSNTTETPTTDHTRLRENLGTDWIYERLTQYLERPTNGRLRFAHYALERALNNKSIRPFGRSASVKI